MPIQLPHSFEELGITPAVLIGAAAGVAAALILGVVIIRRLFRRKPPPETPQPDLSIDVAALPSAGPPPSPRLELLNVPVRIAAVVIAPIGRTATVPNEAALGELLDYVVPRLGAVYAAHRPLVRPWPAQLSSHGFANTFFVNTVLPGNKGKGTPWCTVAGRFECGEQKFLVGLLLCAAAPNSLSQIVVEREAQWLDMLRVRG